ncbi:somatostatin 1, tandem duplicate 1 [Clinocottus analis]|uniref:somatostatin 1, tandem duplicate 1 n=1 Tax=Clinocottus analis TaxID=304258 RepID=UPI0035BEBA6E
MKMGSSSRLLLLLLSLSASFSCSSAAQRDSRLLLHRSPVLGDRQEVSRASLVELLLSDLLQLENEVLQEENFPLADGEPQDVREDLERAAGPLLAPRERKAGCKNFFWKTFTSC